jgi:hypothetical protein
MTSTPIERLEYGDALLERRRTGERPAEIAAAEGISLALLQKILWLSVCYPRESRGGLGDALSSLTVSHLEVPARLPAPKRKRLLARAVRERLTVRDLKILVKRMQAVHPVEISGAEIDLESASRALEIYGTWKDDDLRRLASGRNGSLILRLARAGAELVTRLQPIDALERSQT